MSSPLLESPIALRVCGAAAAETGLRTACGVKVVFAVPVVIRPHWAGEVGGPKGTGTGLQSFRGWPCE